MTTRYRIHHTSSYAYDQAVTASFNEVRQTPTVRPWQIPLESVLRVDQSSWHHRYIDYWGTEVRVFEAHAPHRELVVDVTSLVEVDASRRPTSTDGVSWDELRAEPVTDPHAEFLAVSTFTAPPPELAKVAELLAAQHTPQDSAYAITSAVHDTMTYLPGSTGVHTLAAEAWDSGSGVCQDYAHLVIGALRHVGVPARYVSGYLHPSSAPELGVAVNAQSHAWVQWWLGEWVDHDPTNLADVAERHVIVGTGRDYGDVPPIKGVVAGTPVTTDLTVAVTITRLA
jgi:transglutaminase-like putative cysteine protease